MFAQVVQGGGWRAWGLVDWLIAFVVVAAVIGIVYIALRQFGIVIPDWFKQILLIVLVAVVAILAIRFVVSL